MCAQTSCNSSAAAHTEGTRYLRLQGAVHVRYYRIALERSQNVEQIKNWTGISPVPPECALVFLGIGNGAELPATVRHLLQFRNIQCFILD